MEMRRSSSAWSCTNLTSHVVMGWSCILFVACVGWKCLSIHTAIEILRLPNWIPAKAPSWLRLIWMPWFLCYIFGGSWDFRSSFWTYISSILTQPSEHRNTNWGVSQRLRGHAFLFGIPVEELTDGSRLEPRGILNIQQIDVYLGIEGYARLIYMCV